MIDYADNLTNKRMKELDKRLKSIYEQAFVQAVKNNQEAIEKLSNIPKHASKNEKLRRLKEVERTSNIVDKIASELAHAGDMAAKIIQGEMTGIYNLNYEYSNYDISKNVGLNFNFTIYDKNQIAAILQENESPFTKIAYKNLGKDKIIAQRLGNALAISTINGESQDKLIKRIMDITGQSYEQAKRVAQTERTRVQSQGRNQSLHEASNMGINVAKRWIARMVNTRELHAKSDGEIVKAEEKFSNGLEYPCDPKGEAKNVVGCHCVLQPKVLPRQPKNLQSEHKKFTVTSFEKYEKERGKNNGK